MASSFSLSYYLFDNLISQQALTVSVVLESYYNSLYLCVSYSTLKLEALTALEYFLIETQQHSLEV